jgi:hypothetical protein
MRIELPCLLCPRYSRSSSNDTPFQVNSNYYYWFHDHLKQGDFTMQTVESALQHMNILTKALPCLQFELERKLIMGF